MCSHLNMNTKPIAGLLVWVITLSPSPVSCLLLLFLCPCFSLSPPLSPPWKLDSGSITLLFSSFPSLAKLPCLSGPLGSVHWLLPRPEGYTSFFFVFSLLCLWAVSVQRWDQEMDSIPQQIIQPQTDNDCQLSAVHWARFIKKYVPKIVNWEIKDWAIGYRDSVPK